MSPTSPLCAIVCGLVLSAATQAAEIERKTDTLTLSVERLSTKIWTLSLFCHTVDVHELVPVPRHVLHLGKAHLSLSLLGSLVDMRVELDSFELRDMQLSLLRETNGTLRLFNRDIPEKDLDVIFPEDEEEEASEMADESNFDIPFALIDDLSVTCDDHDTRERVWSIDHAHAELRRWRNPPYKNRDTWTLSMSAGLYTNPASGIAFYSAVRSLPSAPFFHMAFTATHVRVATVDEIVDTVSGDDDEQPAHEAPAAAGSSQGTAKSSPWFERCFSNEWYRLQAATDAQLDDIATNEAVQAFFHEREVNDMSFDLLCDVTISNHMLLPGRLAFTFRRPPPDPAVLTLDYAITNSAEVIVPIDIPQVK